MELEFDVAAVAHGFNGGALAVRCEGQGDEGASREATDGGEDGWDSQRVSGQPSPQRLAEIRGGRVGAA